MFKRYLFEKIRGKTAYQGFFERLHALALEGLNIGGGDCPEWSGEVAVLRLLRAQTRGTVTLFDVGANTGTYAAQVWKVLHPRVRLYCFEPSRVAYETLLERFGGRENFVAYNFGFGASDTLACLFADRNGSELASVFPRRLDHFGIEFQPRESIRLKRLDDFCRDEKIPHIDLLKLDVEGNELNVLTGAERMIKSDSIDWIQFEFGGCNIDSRTFFQDFYYLLTPKYNLYRITRDGLTPIRKYHERLEAFITTNYLAKRRDVTYKLGQD